MSSPQTRRRQRSTRVVVAAALVTTAAVVVIGAVLSASLTLVSVAAVLAVALAAAAVRITHSELVLSRREAAADRAQQAQAYRTLSETRSHEHRVFVDAMGSKLGKATRAVTELESAVVSSQGRAAGAMRRLNAEARRADLAEAEGTRLAVALEESEERAAEAIVRVAELEDENGVLRTENDVLKAELDIATSWPAAGTA
jgi:ABC-type multidrug transport system fused ATPase/permease subunit